MTTTLEDENRLLKEKIQQLISDNLELSARLEHDYNPNKPVRKLTLQDKLALNMGNTLNKYRITSRSLKNIHYTIVASEPEPTYIDLMFDSNRMFTAFYFVDLEKEAKEIEMGESLEVDLDKVPDDMLELQHQYDKEKVLNKITDIES